MQLGRFELKKKTGRLLSLLSLTGLTAFILFSSTQSESSFLNFVASLEKYGTGLAILECLLAAFLSGALMWSLRKERSRRIWIAGLLFTVITLAANLTDYFGTLQLSPDLDMEVSPIWNGLLHDTSMQFARAFGLVGKAFISIVAGACVMFYLRNVQSLAARQQQPLKEILFQMGEQTLSLRDRLTQFATVFTFYFAGANLFCFYVVYANSQVTNLEALSKLPPFPAAVCIALALITGIFVVVTPRLAKAHT